jgi:hypothetical protein
MPIVICLYALQIDEPIYCIVYSVVSVLIPHMRVVFTLVCISY